MNNYYLQYVKCATCSSLHVADLTPPSVEDSLDRENLRGIKD